MTSTDLQVSAQESLKEAALPAAPGPEDVTAEDAALGLFLLQIDALVTCHCKNKERTFSLSENIHEQ